MPDAVFLLRSTLPPQTFPFHLRHTNLVIWDSGKNLPIEQRDLEDSVQNLSLNPGPSTAQPRPSEGVPDPEYLCPSLEQYRKYISPAWKDVTEGSAVGEVTSLRLTIIYLNCQLKPPTSTLSPSVLDDLDQRTHQASSESQQSWAPSTSMF
ncbi:hypothetical protein E4U17_003425 [Claviceps sp. LM77 group G4]|nr:hypothetical protein E4U17_003425 [Claviceps sp. LM77 group G4]